MESSSTSTIEETISKEELNTIFSNTFNLLDITILTADIPSASNKEIFINNEIYYENVNGD